MTKIVPYIVLIKQWSFKMFKIELNAHYVIFWTQIYNDLIVRLSLSFIFIFFSDRRTLKFLKM